MKDTLLIILKFTLAILLLPVVLALTVAFQGQLSNFESSLREALLFGVWSYVLLRFFVYDFGVVYTFGQGMITKIFQFLKPLVNVASYVLPIYTILLLISYGIVSWMGKIDAWRVPFLFLLAFTFSMHLILTAQDLYNKDSGAGKPTYFFSMALIYIADVFLMALLASLIVSGFSFPDFFQGLTSTAGHIYGAVFKQLFGI